jgi:hypothetical protein
MYFSIQEDRQLDSLRERDEEAWAGIQWLKQFLCAPVSRISWLKEGGYLKRERSLLVYFLNEVLCI